MAGTAAARVKIYYITSHCPNGSPIGDQDLPTKITLLIRPHKKDVMILLNYTNPRLFYFNF